MQRGSQFHSYGSVPSNGFLRQNRNSEVGVDFYKEGSETSQTDDLRTRPIHEEKHT